MLRDIGDWERIGFGGKSTLEKEELRSPDNEYYLIKYPRDFAKGVSWEDITELIASKIGSLLSLEMMEVEILMRNGRRGCLLGNFIWDKTPLQNEEGGSLLNIFEDYGDFLNTNLKSHDLIRQGFAFIKRLPYWESFLRPFIHMQFFDILIGNQDRHPYNWMLLFYETNEVQFSPLYDNGASLGFRFDDQKLMTLLTNASKMNKYIKSTKVKAGLFERKQVHAVELVSYLLQNYPTESSEIINEIRNYDYQSYSEFIQSLHIINDIQKEWLLRIIPLRIQMILEWAEGGD